MSIAVLAVALGAIVAAGTPAQHEAEGVVVVAKGHPLLVRSGKRLELVSPARGAEVSGVSDVRDLLPGDRVRYAWRSERAGVRIAERLAADPVLAVDPDLVLLPGNLEQELAAGSVVAIDARPRARWEEGHVPGAISIPAEAPEAALALAPPPPVALAIYGESGRTPDAHALVRRFLAAQRTGVRVVLGGFQAWEGRGAVVVVEPPAVVRGLAAGRPMVFVDVRAEAVAAARPLPGAVSIPLDQMRPGEFAERVRLPPIVLVGEGTGDGAPGAAVERIRRWRFGPDFPPWTLLVLEGGASAWLAARISAPLQVARGPLRWEGRSPPGPGQIDPAEFRALWARQGGDAVVLDVRGKIEPPPAWVKHLPLEELADRLAELPRGREIIVYCSAGYRSAVARELLARNGFRARYLWARPDLP